MIHYITSSGVGQPWVANELSVLAKAGIPFRLHAMRKPEEVHFDSPWAHKMQANTNVLYPLRGLSMIVSVALGSVKFGRRFVAALGNAMLGKRENLRARVACLAHFFVACFWAYQMRRQRVSHIHAQWAYSSASIGMYGAWLLDKPFSFTGHGADVWRDRVALEDKIRRADFIICISQFHRDLYLKHGARPEQLHIVYCGIDVEQFAPPSVARDRSDGVFRIRSSGRLVEKKGFPYLIDACRLLVDRGVDVECVIAGSGPLEDELRQHIERVGLADRVTLTGKAIMQEDIAAFVHSGDVYCLPCVWASDDDADGLPQMLMEAMASGAPVISTRLVGIPDLVIHEQTGLLVEPEDVTALADTLDRLRTDRALGERLAREGRRYVQEKFEIVSALQPLIELYNEKLAAARPGTDAESNKAPEAPQHQPAGTAS